MFSFPPLSKVKLLTKVSLTKLLTSNGSWLEKQQNSILSAAVIITLANVGSSISGLLRQRLLISYFFNTPSSREAFEALMVAFQIPDSMFQLIILGAVSAAFIPIFSGLKKKDEQLAFKMSSSIMNLLLLAFVVIAGVVFVFADSLTAWRTGDAFTPDQIKIAADLTRVMLLAQLFFGVSNVLSAMLQSYQRFILPSIAPILYNLGILAGVYMFAPRFGIYAAGIGVCMGALLHMIVQIPLAHKLGFRFRLQLSAKLEGVKELFKLMPARVLTIGFGELQGLGLGYFATSLGNLSFVMIKLASTLMTIPIRLFGVPISQASLPFLSDESDVSSRERFKELVNRSLHQIAFLAYPASILLLILRLPVVRLVFGAKNFPWPTTLMTSKVVAIIALSIAAQAMAQLFIRAFYALKDTKTPLYITFVVVLAYLGGCAYSVFVADYGLLGVAAVTSLSAVLELVLFVHFFDKKIGQFITNGLLVPQIKIMVASFLMAVFLYLPYRVLDELVFNTTKTIELIGLTVTTSTIGMLVYVYFASLLRIHELDHLVSAFRSRVGRLQRSSDKTHEVLVETMVDDDTI
jgi:putative peptidoglycan lipid II flippase